MTESNLGAVVGGPARDALRAIAELLASDSPAVSDRVTLAIDYPERYVEVQNDLYSQTLEKPHPEMAWFALVDALHEQELLAWVDWNEDAAEVLGRLRQLESAPGAAHSWKWADELAAGYDRTAGLETLLAASAPTSPGQEFPLPGSTATAIRFSSCSSRVFKVQLSSNSRWQPVTVCACSSVSAFAEQAA
ncbi:hypothetical protein GCM10020255_101520 [Rhodococcus baikonurensis]